MNVRQKNNQKGFTIIEVVLVLAIAGLIFLMVFIALPALQRNQRDTQRKNDLSRAQTAIQNYQTNNRNALPADAEFNSVLKPKYLKAGSDSFSDPNGNDYTFRSGSPPADFNTTASEIFFTRSAVCNGDNALTTGQGATKIAFQYKLEGGGTACVNN